MKQNIDENQISYEQEHCGMNIYAMAYHNGSRWRATVFHDCQYVSGFGWTKEAAKQSLLQEIDKIESECDY